MRKFFVIMIVFLSVFLMGCGADAAAAEPRSRLRASEPSLTTAASPTTSGMRPLYGYDPALDIWPWDDLPLATNTGVFRGAPLPTDDLPDASAEAHNTGEDSGRNWMEPTVRLLAANTCNDRPLHLSSEVSGWLHAGYALWHVCYETPSATTSEHPFAALGRPTQVAFTFFHEPSQTQREITHVSAPRGTAPWMVNALIILPPSTRPLLNLENRYANGDHLYAIQPVRWNEAIERHGLLHPWQVNPDATQTLSVPGVLCMYVSPRDILTGREYFFVPHTACLDGVESCRLNAYECTDQFSSSL